MHQYRNKKIKVFKILPIAVVIYMLAAFSWWAVLLFRSNADIISLKKELFEIKQIDAVEFQKSFIKYQLHQKMILGEGLFFAISIIAGITFIYRGYLKEAKSGKMQKNFLMSVTHELKSPLSAIKLILETFRKRPQLEAVKVDGLIKDALSESERLQYLIEDLLFSSQLEESWAPDFQKIDVSMKTKEIIEKYTNKNQDIIITYINHAKKPIYLKADEQAYISIVRNLIDNAIKYSFAPKKIDVVIDQENNSILLKVSDNGIGIPDNEKKNIFTKFYRIGDEETRNTKGTGLGLYIVEKIVIAHQGSITVNNNQPKGTIFVVKLPIRI